MLDMIGAQVVQAYSRMGMEMDFCLFSPGCASKCFVNFDGIVCFYFGIFYVFGEYEFEVEGEA